MKKLDWIFFLILSFVFVCFYNQTNIDAKEILAQKNYNDIFGSTLGSIEIYDTGDIVIKYKYGLRRADLRFCQKGKECDEEVYTLINLMESNQTNPYKNTGTELASYTYKFNGEKDVEYRVKVEAYFGVNSGYTGLENVQGSYVISSMQSVSTGNSYIKGTYSLDKAKDKRVSGLLAKMQEIINTLILPIAYVVTTFVLVIKGALLGVGIVKSADFPDVRREKVGALKWLIIGVTITYAASSLVAVITGFFKEKF